MIKISTLFIGAALTFSFAANAQLKTPQPSPTATLQQAVGLTDIEVIYSRPGSKGRTIFGELVPFGEIWRTGANSSTKIKVADDVKIGGQAIPAGQYAIYTIPGADVWTIIIYKGLENWGAGGYDKAQDVARFDVKPTKLTDTYETFTIDFSDLETSNANLNLIWENTKVTLPIETPTDTQVEKQINEMMAGPSANSYYGAARFYLEKEKELDKAEIWISQAIELRPEAFWMIHVQAKILAKNGKKKEAIVAAEKSMKMAKESKDGDYGYVESNEKLIKEIKSMK
jgi:tetratricopeptide (TPR) repeat protein